MTIDDQLRRRLTAAADQVGQTADPATARAALRAAIVAGGRVAPWILGIFAVAGLAVGIALGVTLSSAGDGAAVGETDRIDGSGMGAEAGGGGDSSGDRNGPDGGLAGAPSEVRIAGARAAYRTFDCPDGAETDRRLRPGDRVLVIGTDAGGAWLAVRDPAAVARTVWLPASAVQPDIALDVDELDCPDATPTVVVPSATTSTTTTTTTTTPARTTTSAGGDQDGPAPTAESSPPPAAVPPAPSPVTPAGPPATNAPQPVTTPPAGTTPPAPTAPPTPAPTPPSTPPPTPAPTPPPDTEAPSVGNAFSTPNVIYVQPCPGADLAATVNVFASDDVGVASVRGTHALGSFDLSGPAGGGSWTGTFGPFSAPAGSPQVTITLTARDAAGNTATTTTTVTVFSCPF